MKTLAQLKAECSDLGLTIIEDRGRKSKEPYIAALRDHHWRLEHPEDPLPPQISPMLLGNWSDLDPDATHRTQIESGEAVQRGRPRQGRLSP